MKDKTTLSWILLTILLVNMLLGTQVVWGSSGSLFESPVTYNVGYCPYDVETADLNGDGNLDIVSMTRLNATYTASDSSSGQCRASILDGSPAGTFVSIQSPTTWDGPTPDPGNHFTMLPYLGKRFVARDIDGDTKTDLAFRSLMYDTQTNLTVYSGNGDFSFSYVGYDSTYAVSQGISIVSGDFDPGHGNGLDIAYLKENTVCVTQGHTSGALNAGTSYPVGTNPRDLTTGDFNGDSKLDLAVVNGGDNTVSVLLGNGDGTFQASVSYSVGSQPESIVAADFNGDGMLDLAIANSGGNTVSILLGTGGGSFGAQTTLSVGGTPESLVSADFNQDGKQDLAVANSGDNTITVLTGNGDGTFATEGSYAVGHGPCSLTVGDYNKDGAPDLAVANFTDNSISVLKNVGITISTSTLPSGVANSVYTSGALSVSGGTAPYTWSATGLPAGLSMNVATGAITGTPAASGTSTVHVTVNAGTAHNSKDLSLTMNPALAVSTSSLTTATVGSVYLATVSATGGVAPYTWSATGLPAGLTIGSGTGAISGTPTSSGMSTVHVTVTDSTTATISSDINLTVNPPGLAISTSSLASGTVGSAYSTTVNATGGVSPYVWSATGLPAGLTIGSGTGIISGTPTISGTSTVHLTVTDHTTATISCDLSLTVNAVTSSSGGGGGSRTTVIAAPATITTAVLNTETRAGEIHATVDATLDASGTAVATFSDQGIQEAIGKALATMTGSGAEAHPYFEIIVKTPAGANAVASILSDGSLKAIAESKLEFLRITTPMGTMTFDKAALLSIAKQASGNIQIEMKPVATGTLPAAAQNRFAAHPVFEFAITSGGKAITDFGGSRIIAGIPYVLQPGERVDNLFAYYIAPGGGLQKLTASRYDAASEFLRFATPHLSTYGIGYEDSRFDDVSGWYSESVQYLSARGVLKGTSKNHFDPDSKITRAEFVQMLANLSGAELKSKATGFSDVKTEDWFSSAVGWANGNGIVAGAGGNFTPNAPITRQDMAVLLTRYADKADKSPFLKADVALTFSDKGQIAPYAADAVKSLQQAGILAGKENNQFNPTDNASRAEAAKVMALYLKSLVK